MFINHQLVKLLANDQKRRAFVNNYKAWGLWFSQPELDLTYFKYDLPCGGKIIAMEYLRVPFPSEKPAENHTAVVCKSFYLQTGDYFSPTAVSDYTVAEHLKNLKATLAKELAESEVA